MYLSEDGQTRGRNMYEQYYVYKIKYMLLLVSYYNRFFLPVTTKKTISKNRGNTASEKRLSFLLSHIPNTLIY